MLNADHPNINHLTIYINPWRSLELNIINTMLYADHPNIIGII